MAYERYNTVVKESPIHGFGWFAARDIKPNETIDDPPSSHRGINTSEGTSRQPNVVTTFNKTGGFYARAVRPILKGEEILTPPYGHISPVFLKKAEEARFKRIEQKGFGHMLEKAERLARL